jgi:hypothetical protein
MSSGWTQTAVPISALGNPADIQRISIQDEGGAARPPFYLDDLRLVP